MTRLFAIFIVILMSFPAMAMTSDERTTLRAQLLNNLKSAKTEAEGRAAENAIRYFWLKGPDIDATAKLLTAIQARRHYDFSKAMLILNKLIADTPDYAEAYNQRAFLYFLLRKYDKSLEDIEITLAKEPMHFGAITGRAIIFLHQGRSQLARKSLIQAIGIHPWLRERVFLTRIPAS
ncbi:MAG: tetratricopeptide repeat protein [Methyloligellaceae bacterium]